MHLCCRRGRTSWGRTQVSFALEIRWFLIDSWVWEGRKEGERSKTSKIYEEGERKEPNKGGGREEDRDRITALLN